MSNNLETLFNKAFQLQRDGKLAQAMETYEILLVKNPLYVEAVQFLGLCHAERGDMKQAIHYFEQAVSLQVDNARLHNNLATAYKRVNQIDKAIAHYRQAIHLDANYAQAHNNLATLYDQQGDFQNALRQYRAAIHSEPDFVAAHFNLGLLLLKNNQLSAAKKQFNNVLSLYPHHLDAQFYLGILHLENNELLAAECAFQEVLTLNGEHVQALTNLGVIAIKNQQPQLAVDYFTKALAFDNNNMDARNNLAATFIHHDRFENALMHYDVLLKHDPRNIEYLYNLGVAQMALGHLNEATHHFDVILTLDAKHFATLSNLAAIYLRLGQHDQAITFLQRALTVNPHDKSSEYMLKALTGGSHPPQACSPYVTNLFNNYALNYDQHMQTVLHYLLPQHIAKLLHRFCQQPIDFTLDLGCGTGLTGLVLREISNHVTGVDLSQKMLDQARQKSIYDELELGEIITYLQTITQQYGLIVAADVIPYLGELDTLFACVSKCIANQGFFVFSHEITEEQPWQLQHTARFSHQPRYVAQLCEHYGFTVLAQDKVVARQQQDKDLYVMLYVVQRTG